MSKEPIVTTRRSQDRRDLLTRRAAKLRATVANEKLPTARRIRASAELIDLLGLDRIAAAAPKCQTRPEVAAPKT
jgi:hypothetical protein